MDRVRKEQVVADLKASFENVGALVVVHNQGLSASDMVELRQQIREAGGSFQVVKNTLLKLATVGTDYEALEDLFTGPTAVAYSEDPVAAAKVVSDFADENEKLVIRGGALGAEIMDVSRVKALAKLPSLDELRAKILGMLNTPATRLACLAQAPGGQVARVINAYASSGGEQ